MSKTLRHFYEFGSFQLEPDERLLLRHGEAVDLPPKAFDTLLLLIKNRGRLVSKDELMQAVWPGTAVEDGNLTLAVHNLRRALVNGSDSGRYIETVPRYGYRFKAEVVERWEERLAITPALPAAERHPGPDQPEARSKRPLARWQLAAGIVICVVLLIAALVYRTRRASVNRTESIAVLRFLNLTSDSSNQYLSDGLSEELTTRLAQIPQLKVAARTSAFQFQGKPRDIREIGRRLNVGAVLEGSVARSGDQLHVTAQLISVRDGYHRWSASYDRPPEQLQEIQEAITQQVSKALGLPLSAEQQARLIRRDTANPEAHDLYLEARYLWNQRSRESRLEQSIALFQKAIDKDPKYAPAYAGLANAYAVAAVNNSSATFAPAAKIAARNALSLDQTLAEPHAALGLIESQVEWKFDDAELEFQQALALDFNNAAAHHWRGLNLTILGRFHDAETEFRQAQILDPTALMITDGLAENFYYERQYDNAIAQAQNMLQADSGMPAALIMLGRAHLEKKMYPECVKAAAEMSDETGLPELKSLMIAEAEAELGHSQRARTMGAQLEKTALSRSELAGLYATLGDSDRAFRLLQQAYEAHEPHLAYLKLDPRYDALRPDARYAALLREIGLKK